MPAALALLDQPEGPTAIIAEGSRFLRAVVLAARAVGKRVPEDLSLVGIDAEDTATAASPEITCILRDFGEIGRTAAELMLHRLGGRPPGPAAGGAAVPRGAQRLLRGATGTMLTIPRRSLRMGEACSGRTR